MLKYNLCVSYRASLYPGTDTRIILKWNLKMWVWTGLTWLRIRTSNGFL
jgi:hypothetical protein